MIYNDPIYGKIQIKEKILIDLINSKGLQRIKGIYQHGTPDIIGWLKPVTRFEHSMGSMILVKKAGGSLDEQIAALLHDISHYSFSHIIDLVYADKLKKDESLHEVNMTKVVQDTDIPKYLGSKWKKYFDEKKWKLLEQPSPALCADRGDYTPRDSVALNFLGPSWTKRYSNSLEINNGQLVINSLKIGRGLLLASLKLDKYYYSHPRGFGLYILTARILNRLIELNKLKLDYFRTNPDMKIWKEILKSKDPIIKEKLEYIMKEKELMKQNKTMFVLTKNHLVGDKYKLISKKIYVKFRYIDPLIKQSDIIKQMTEWDKRLFKRINKIKKIKSGVHKLYINIKI